MKKILIIALALFSTNAIAQTPTPLTYFTPGAGPNAGLVSTTNLNKIVDQVNNLTGNGTSTNVVATRFYAGNGTVALPSFTFSSDPDIGIYRIGANNIGIGVNAAKVLDIGTTGLGVTGVITSGAHAITSASANALVAGLAGATNPAFNVDASTASSATGLQIKSAAAAGGVAILALSSGTDESVTFNAKGAGTITFNGTATGNIVMGRAMTGVSTTVTGAITSRSATAVAAAASVTPAFLTSSTALLGVYFGTGSPNTALTAAKGSIYFRTDGSTTNDRAYINTDGSTAWTAITTAS